MAIAYEDHPYRWVYVVEQKSPRTGERIRPKAYLRKPAMCCYHYSVLSESSKDAKEMALFMHEKAYRKGRL